MNDLVTIKNLSALADLPVTRELVESNDFGAQYAALKDAINILTAAKKAIDDKVSEIIAPLYAEDGTTTVSNDKYNFTYCAATTILAVDSAKLKKEFPDVYKQCVKTSQRAASLRVTEKKGK